MSSGIDAVLFLCVTLILGAEVDSLQFGSGARDRTAAHFIAYEWRSKKAIYDLAF